jgi:hypothetical protein
MVTAQSNTPVSTDVTGDFWTSGRERESRGEERWYADQEIQAGTDHGVVAPGLKW